MPKKFDILVHSGDFTHTGEYTIMQDFNEWLGEQPSSHNIIVAGNHELSLEKHPYFSKIFTNAIYLQDESVIVSGLKFYGSPYTLSFNNWAFNMNSNVIYQKWDKIPTNTDILITHGPAYGILDLNDDPEHCGDKALLETIKKIKPKIHACGHIHSGYGVLNKHGVKFINASILDNGYNMVNEPIVVNV